MGTPYIWAQRLAGKYFCIVSLDRYWFAPSVTGTLRMSSLDPDVRGPGADSGSDQIGSAPAPGKKRRLRLHSLKIFHFELLKSELLMQVFLDHIYRYKLLLSHALSQQQGFPFLLTKKMQPTLQKAAPANKKNRNRLWLYPKSGGSRRLLCNTGYYNFC